MALSSSDYWKNAYRCLKCKDTGWLSRYDKSKPIIYQESFIPCTCEEGRQRYSYLVTGGKKNE